MAAKLSNNNNNINLGMIIDINSLFQLFHFINHLALVLENRLMLNNDLKIYYIFTLDKIILMRNSLRKKKGELKSTILLDYLNSQNLDHLSELLSNLHIGVMTQPTKIFIKKFKNNIDNYVDSKSIMKKKQDSLVLTEIISKLSENWTLINHNNFSNSSNSDASGSAASGSSDASGSAASGSSDASGSAASGYSSFINYLSQFRNPFSKSSGGRIKLKKTKKNKKSKKVL